MTIFSFNSDLHLEKAEILCEMDWMYEWYSGCDWCCGGGDERMAELNDRLKEIDRELES